MVRQPGRAKLRVRKHTKKNKACQSKINDEKLSNNTKKWTEWVLSTYERFYVLSNIIKFKRTSGRILGYEHCFNRRKLDNKYGLKQKLTKHSKRIITEENLIINMD